MKHKLSKRVLLALALCVACVLAFGATLAQAAENVDSGKGGENSLTVDVGSKAQLDALTHAGIKYNLYRVASANKSNQYDTYNYDFDVEAFDELGSNFDQQTITESKWQEMAKAAKGIVERDNLDADVKDVDAGNTVTGLQNGLYLVFIPDTMGDRYNFKFQPVLVSLPSKVDDTGAPVYTTDQGTWTGTTNAVYLLDVKWSMERLTGSIKIIKDVRNPTGDPATFTYRITGVGDDNKYNNPTAIMFSTDGEMSKTIDNIPAGYEYMVTEVDSGAQYKIVSENNQTVEVKPGQTAEVTFVNEPKGTDDPEPGTQGYGIENHFVFKDGQWQHEQRTINKNSNE